MDIFYKNQSQNKYADIIDKRRPVSTQHTPMSIQNRAKIFSPFSALKGYEDALRTKEKIVVAPMELSDDMKELLDEKLHTLENLLNIGEHPMITVVYFHPSKLAPDGKGEYLEVTGMAAKLDLDSRILQIVDTRIDLGNICGLQGEIFSSLEESIS